MIVKLLTEHHLEFLSLTGGCRGLSESTHVKMPHCWKSHALAHISIRHGCIEPAFQTTDKSLYSNEDSFWGIWMVTECAKEVPDFLRELCENPEADDSFKSLVPVSTKTVTYRNKFCALCNGVDFIATLFKWHLDIRCRSHLDMWDKNLMRKLKESECEVIFKSPDEVDTNKCEVVPPYHISSCNVTGQWGVYDETTELACHSFIDPFDSKYQNYWCYLCNTAVPQEPETMFCQTPDNVVSDIAPPFSALVDLDVIQAREREVVLQCDKETQFEDTISVCII